MCWAQGPHIRLQQARRDQTPGISEDLLARETSSVETQHASLSAAETSRVTGLLPRLTHHPPPHALAHGFHIAPPRPITHHHTQTRGCTRKNVLNPLKNVATRVHRRSCVYSGRGRAGFDKKGNLLAACAQRKRLSVHLDLCPRACSEALLACVWSGALARAGAMRDRPDTLQPETASRATSML